MSDRPLSRRQVLAGVTAFGFATGTAASGRGTLGRFADAERFGLSSRVGDVDLVVDWEHDGESRSALGGHVPVGLDAGSGETELTVSLAGDVPNPAAVWLRADCPVPDGTALADALDVTVSYCDGRDAVGVPIDGSLLDVTTGLRDGVRLDGGSGDGCLAPEDDLCLRVSWTLPEGASGNLEWNLAFAAVQCRHDDGTNPFAGVEPVACSGPEPCDCCVAAGKIELPASGYLGPGTYEFAESNPAFGAYEFVVTDSVENEDGETIAIEFRLDPVGDAPPARLCGVDITAAGTCRPYRRADEDASGPATGRLLYGPERSGRPPAGISHITVRLCAETGDCDDPRWAKNDRCSD